MLITFIISANIASFDTALLRARLLEHLPAAEDVLLAIAPASVVVDARIIFTSADAAESTREWLQRTSTAVLSALLSVSIEAKSTASMANVYMPAPLPPSPAPSLYPSSPGAHPSPTQQPGRIGDFDPAPNDASTLPSTPAPPAAAVGSHAITARKADEDSATDSDALYVTLTLTIGLLLGVGCVSASAVKCLQRLLKAGYAKKNDVEAVSTEAKMVQERGLRDTSDCGIDESVEMELTELRHKRDANSRSSMTQKRTRLSLTTEGSSPAPATEGAQTYGTSIARTARPIAARESLDPSSEPEFDWPELMLTDSASDSIGALSSLAPSGDEVRTSLTPSVLRRPSDDDDVRTAKTSARGSKSANIRPRSPRDMLLSPRGCPAKVTAGDAGVQRWNNRRPALSDQPREGGGNTEAAERFVQALSSMLTTTPEVQAACVPPSPRLSTGGHEYVPKTARGDGRRLSNEQPSTNRSTGGATNCDDGLSHAYNHALKQANEHRPHPTRGRA